MPSSIALGGQFASRLSPLLDRLSFFSHGATFIKISFLSRLRQPLLPLFSPTGNQQYLAQAFRD
jgi:hypothetical protein